MMIFTMFSNPMFSLYLAMCSLHFPMVFPRVRSPYIAKGTHQIPVCVHFLQRPARVPQALRHHRLLDGDTRWRWPTLREIWMICTLWVAQWSKYGIELPSGNLMVIEWGFMRLYNDFMDYEWDITLW